MIQNLFYFLFGLLTCFVLLGILSLFYGRNDQEAEKLRELPTKEEQDKLNKSNLKQGI